ANQLSKTGLFSNVKYTYTSAGPHITVTFEIEEAPSKIPVIFDNVVWMSDEELKAALRADVPEFDGTTTAYAGASDLIAAALQKVLQARNLPGRVSVRPVFPIGATTSDPIAFNYSVADPSLNVCALHVSGASAIPEKDLVGQLNGVIGDSYSRSFLVAASSGTLADMYHRLGHWRATFATPAVALKECNGVAVTLNVNEGPEYAWDHAVWTGNAALPAPTLDNLLGMKSGEMANASKIGQGVIAIRGEYGKHGYLEQAARYEPQLDDAARRATFAFTIHEGSQYRMGTLQFDGIRDADADKLRKQWQLKPGDVFDESYMKEYQTKVLDPLRSPSGGRPVLDLMLDHDHQVANLTVRVQ
ncbi:MAG: POTRA domain-containing protein, partial [Vicinamibacterales bacterium]